MPSASRGKSPPQRRRTRPDALLAAAGGRSAASKTLTFQITSVGADVAVAAQSFGAINMPIKGLL